MLFLIRLMVVTFVLFSLSGGDVFFPVSSSGTAWSETLENTNQIETEKNISGRRASRRKRLRNTKLISFYLKNDKLVTGKVVSEDKNELILAELDGSRIILGKYGKKQINLRTASVSMISENEYYEKLAEYFYSRTGDFQDDPDDFIQAIRFYEKAKRSVLDDQPDDSEKAHELEQSIQKIKADRDVWTRQMRSRAELKQLELEVMFEQKMEQIQQDISENEMGIETISETINEFTNNFADWNEQLNLELDRLVEMTDINMANINLLGNRRSQSPYMGFPLNYNQQGYYPAPLPRINRSYTENRN